MSTQLKHLHLLTPTVREADDVVGFDRPLNPYGLLFVAAMSGMVPAGLFLAHNAPRLGLKRWQWPTLILTLLAGGAIFWGYIFLLVALVNTDSPWWDSVTGMGSTVQLALRVGLFALIAWPQFHRYRIAPRATPDKRTWIIVVVTAILWAIGSPTLIDPVIDSVVESFVRPR